MFLLLPLLLLLPNINSFIYIYIYIYLCIHVSMLKLYIIHLTPLITATQHIDIFS